MDFSQEGTNYLWPEWHFYDDSCIILAILYLKRHPIKWTLIDWKSLKSCGKGGLRQLFHTHFF